MIVQTKLQRIEKCTAFLFLLSDWFMKLLLSKSATCWSIRVHQRDHTLDLYCTFTFCGCNSLPGSILYLKNTTVVFPVAFCWGRQFGTRLTCANTQLGALETKKLQRNLSRLLGWLSRSCLTRKRVGSFSCIFVTLCMLKSSFKSLCTQGMMRAEIRHDGLESKEASCGENKQTWGSWILCSDSKAVPSAALKLLKMQNPAWHWKQPLYTLRCSDFGLALCLAVHWQCV